MRDLKNHTVAAQSLAPAALVASANGAWIDLLGANGAMVHFDIGAWTNGAFTLSVDDADETNQSDAAAVPAANLEGALTVVDGAPDDNVIQTVGYKGGKRYIRAVVTEPSSPNPGTGCVIGASVVYSPLVRPAA